MTDHIDHAIPLVGEETDAIVPNEFVDLRMGVKGERQQVTEDGQAVVVLVDPGELLVGVQDLVDIHRVWNDIKLGELLHFLLGITGFLHLIQDGMVKGIRELVRARIQRFGIFPSASDSNGGWHTMGEIQTYFISVLNSGSGMIS